MLILISFKIHNMILNTYILWLYITAHIVAKHFFKITISVIHPVGGKCLFLFLHGRNIDMSVHILKLILC